MVDAADIYRTDDGLAAVTSDVQRQILRALTEGSKQLPELVAVTGRSKPTLSSLHMKELLARGLIEEQAHPTDSRRKVYSLAASRVIPADTVVPPGPGRLDVGLAAALDAIAAVPGTMSSDLHAQALQLGQSLRPQLGAPTRRELWLRIPAILEENAVATPLRVDLQQGFVELKPAPGIAAPPQRFAVVLAGLVSGLAGGAGRIEGLAIPEGVRLQLG